MTDSNIPSTYCNIQALPFDADEKALFDEIQRLLDFYRCARYGELVLICMQLGGRYCDVLRKNSAYFDRLCSKLRCSSDVSHIPESFLYFV